MMKHGRGKTHDKVNHVRPFYVMKKEGAIVWQEITCRHCGDRWSFDVDSRTISKNNRVTVIETLCEDCEDMMNYLYSKQCV